ncbi:hypothetical protein FOQG_15735 [Fusarium oxysporum f. sp. raphani 54005]|uniref:Uncharacterized protein n=1 Tax=Fusarium oxysporum f. sp. raphani 54005 TaxID=1089458 RepID=X0BC45_FUSOX|nr:hypothetical protein FOQG_15735 [Fusarium oxysporum f. sp. raphani 54005]
MPSDEMTSVPLLPLLPLLPSPPRPYSVFSCKSSDKDDVSAKELSDDTATTISSGIQSEDGNLEPKTAIPTDQSTPSIPPSLEHRTEMDSVLEWVQNVEHTEDLMSEGVVPESPPISICFQLLLPAILLLSRLQEALGHEPMRISEKYNTTTVCGSEEYIATKEHKIDEFFTDDIDVIGMSTLMGVTNRFGSCEACSIHGIIFGKVGLLKIMRNLRAYCQDSEHMQSLPITLRYVAATMYVEFFECCTEVFDLPRETGGIGTT